VLRLRQALVRARVRVRPRVRVRVRVRTRAAAVQAQTCVQVAQAALVRASGRRLALPQLALPQQQRQLVLLQAAVPAHPNPMPPRVPALGEEKVQVQV
jgi:hypothetical protein